MTTRAARPKPEPVAAIATVEVVAKADAPALAQHVLPLTKTVEALVVKDAASFTQAGEYLKTVAAYIKRVGEVLDPIVQSAHQAHQVALRQRNGLLQPAENAKRVLSQRMDLYDREQKRLRDEAERRQREEQARRQREEDDRVAAERKRLEEETQARALELAAEAERHGDPERADRILIEPVHIEMPVPRVVFVPPARVAVAPKVEGVSFRPDWDFEITDEAAIPREYMAPDEVKIRRVVKAMRGKIEIPGVKVIEKSVTAVRSQ